MIGMAMEACDIDGITTVAACRAFGVSRATLDRRRNPRPTTPKQPKQSHRRLSEEEKKAILEELTSTRFVDESVPEVYTTLLDEGVYICSQRTIYRILEREAYTRERRDQRHHPEYTKPELLATGPNQVWSWDITKLKGAQKWTYHYLYVIMDIYSRYVVGWLVAPRESAALAERLIEQTCENQGIERGELTIHADRGTSMRSKLVAQLMADLGVTKSHSRPYTSNDNPYSEAQFKTLKYRHSFPKTFGCIEDAGSFLRGFFSWYNGQHKHSGIGYVTPEDMHTGRAHAVREERCKVLKTAYEKHPERFVKGTPRPPDIPEAAYINKPKKKAA
jgi:putative transposase